MILAGGQGRRMGPGVTCDKARLHWRGQSLLQRWTSALRQQAAEVLVARTRPRPRLPGISTIWDQRPQQGPVFGLQAGLRRARRAWCLFVPVDSLPPRVDLLRHLATRSRHGGYLQSGPDGLFLHCLIARRQRRTLDAFINAGGRSAANAGATLRLQAVPIAPSLLPVASINTRIHWRQLQRRRR